MRVLMLSVLALGLAACETTSALPPDRGAPAAQPAPGANAPITGLPAQRMAPGDCGIFLFEVRAPSNFIFYENETVRSVEIVHGGEVYRFATPPQAEAFLTGEAFTRVYGQAGADMSFTLNGRVGEDTPSGVRLQDMVLIAEALDGTRTVRPVAGVRRCDGG